MKGTSLAIRLGVAFAVVAAATALIAAVLLSFGWQRQFEAYVQRGVQERANAAAEVLAREYETAGGWDGVAFVELAHFGMINGLRVRVFDADGALVAFSAGRMGGMMMRGMSDPDEAVVTARAPVVVGGRTVGEVAVARNEPGGLLTARDMEFRRATLAGLLGAALIAVGLATIAGVLYARGITRPITEVTRVAAALRGGDREARTGMHGPDPVGALGETLDGMADAIEADRRFERQLTADVAHELRTPLQAIQATVEAIQDGVLPADAERLGLLHDETVRLGRLAGSLLELSRLEAGSTALRMEPLDLAEPVAAAVENARALMESRGHTLVEEYGPGCVVRADRERIAQAVGNLLANAGRYTPEGGTVHVRVRRMVDHGVIEVTDSGPGVAETDRTRVFERFWRADPARARESGGLGIGLAVVREIAERHGGSVSVGDSELGGACFTIRLPLESVDVYTAT